MKIDALNTNMVQPIGYDPARTDIVKEKDAAAEEQKKADEARQERQEEAAAVNASVYGDVISRDEDGDTVAAQKQSLEALEDGMVFAKENNDEEETTGAVRNEQENVTLPPQQEEKSAAEKLAEEEAKEAREEKQQSLTGVSANELETMYLQGKITRYQYDQEIGRRDVLMEKEEKTVGQAEEEEDEKEENNPNAEAIQEQIKEDNSFAERMGRLSNATVEEDIRAEALKTANENDRVDLVTKVFDAN